MTPSKRNVYDRIARLYDLLDVPFERGRYRPLRQILLDDVRGTVLDAGVGTGANMPFYPPDAAVIGIDLSPNMLRQADQRRAELGLNVALQQMDVTAMAFPDHHFDYVISSFMFCVLDDERQLPALRELGRVCKPAGEIRIIEYAYSSRPLRRLIMHLWAPWVRWIYGARFDRQPERYADAAGLDLSEERYLFKDMIKMLVLRPRRA